MGFELPPSCVFRRAGKHGRQGLCIWPGVTTRRQRKYNRQAATVGASRQNRPQSRLFANFVTLTIHAKRLSDGSGRLLTARPGRKAFGIERDLLPLRCRPCVRLAAPDKTFTSGLRTCIFSSEIRSIWDTPIAEVNASSGIFKQLAIPSDESSRQTIGVFVAGIWYRRLIFLVLRRGLEGGNDAHWRSRSPSVHYFNTRHQLSKWRDGGAPSNSILARSSTSYTAN